MPTIFDANRFGVAVLGQNTFRIYQRGGGYEGKDHPAELIYFPWITGQTVVNDARGGGILMSSPAAAGAHVVALGSNYNVWYSQNGNGAWSQLPGGTLTSAPAICVDAAGLIRVFAVGLDAQMWHTWKPSGGNWAAWEPAPVLSVGVKSAPSIASRGAGSVDVVVQGNDNHVHHLSWDPAAKTWTQWDLLEDAVTDAPPACCWWGNSTFHVFCRSAATPQLLHTYFDWAGGWGRWHNPLSPASPGWGADAPAHPKGLSSGPVTAVDKNGRVDVFARTPGAEVSNVRWAPETGWQSWKAIPVNSVFYPA
jgi:hypothetical protein